MLQRLNMDFKLLQEPGIPNIHEGPSLGLTETHAGRSILDMANYKSKVVAQKSCALTWNYQVPTSIITDNLMYCSSKHIFTFKTYQAWFLDWKLTILAKILLGIFIKQWATIMDIVTKIQVSWSSSTQFQVETNGCKLRYEAITWYTVSHKER
jgi:hypothetical protein